MITVNKPSMKNLTLSLLLLAVTFYGCKDDPIPPTAYFSYAVKGNFSPCKVEFTAAPDAESFQWILNGSTIVSTDQSPAITFDSPGTYEVTLSVTGNGASNQSTQLLVIPAQATIMKINSVTLTSYPLLKDGAKWDIYPVTSGPDISFHLFGPSLDKPALYAHNTAFDDRLLVENLKFELPADACFPLQPEGYHLVVVDKDNAGYADIMGDLFFNPWETIQSQKSYPSSFTITRNGITALLEVTWR